jgi:pyruvate-formate lyase-activating enzyme
VAVLFVVVQKGCSDRCRLCANYLNSAPQVELPKINTLAQPPRSVYREGQERLGR